MGAILSALFLCKNLGRKECETMWNNPYQPYFNQSYQQNQYNQQNIQRTEVIKVNGEGGAKAFQMAPNSSVLLLDETAPIVWLKTTDGAGYPAVTPYSITPYKPAPPVDVNGLEQRIARLEEMINAKPDTTNAKRRKSEEAQSSNDSAG
jgi:hypothetical protein